MINYPSVYSFQLKLMLFLFLPHVCNVPSPSLLDVFCSSTLCSRCQRCHKICTFEKTNKQKMLSYDVEWQLKGGMHTRVVIRCGYLLFCSLCCHNNQARVSCKTAIFRSKKRKKAVKYSHSTWCSVSSVYTQMFIFHPVEKLKCSGKKTQRIYPSVHNLLHNVPVDILVNIRQNWQWVEIRELRCRPVQYNSMWNFT